MFDKIKQIVGMPKLLDNAVMRNFLLEERVEKLESRTEDLALRLCRIEAKEKRHE